ncbi:MAG: peptidase, partial [Planktothrix sp.]
IAIFDDWSAFTCTLIGWVVLQILQRTIGRPILAFSRWLSNWAAGTSLITDPKQLEQMLMNGSDPQLVTVGKEIWLEAEQQEETPQRKPSSWIKFIVLSALALLLVLIFTPTDKNPFYIWFGLLNDSLRLAVKLIQYSLIALLISIILTPLESLSWWAGWYGVQPLQNPGQLVSEACPDTP